jgi:regulator of replication initiation timing
MNNEALIPIIEGLETKLKRLIKDHESLKKELIISMDENKTLRTQVEMQNAELKNFQNHKKATLAE